MTTDILRTAATSAETLGQEYLVMAVQAERDAEQAQSFGDWTMAKIYAERADRYYADARRREGDAQFYRDHIWLAEQKLTYPKIEAKLEAAE